MGSELVQLQHAGAPGIVRASFDLFKRLLATGIDMYAYATMTAENGSDVRGGISRFVDRLQQVHQNLPLRLVPLEIVPWGVVKTRLAGELRMLNDSATRAIAIQRDAVAAWKDELVARFSTELRCRPIQEVPMRLGS
jgi:hypothetical protein